MPDGIRGVPFKPGPALLPRRLCFALAAAVVFQLFYLETLPGAAGLLQPPWDTIAHFFVYAALTALLWIAAAGRMPLAVVAAVILVGGLDEMQQAGPPGRVADFVDFLVAVWAAAFTSALMLLLEARGLAGSGGGQAGSAEASEPPFESARLTSGQTAPRAIEIGSAQQPAFRNAKGARPAPGLAAEGSPLSPGLRETAR